MEYYYTYTITRGKRPHTITYIGSGSFKELEKILTKAELSTLKILSVSTKRTETDKNAEKLGMFLGLEVLK